MYVFGIPGNVFKTFFAFGFPRDVFETFFAFSKRDLRFQGVPSNSSAPFENAPGKTRRKTRFKNVRQEVEHVKNIQKAPEGRKRIENVFGNVVENVFVNNVGEVPEKRF